MHGRSRYVDAFNGRAAWNINPLPAEYDLRFCSLPVPLESNRQDSEPSPGARIWIRRIHSTGKTTDRFGGHHSKNNCPSMGKGSESFEQSAGIKMNAVLSNSFSSNAGARFVSGFLNFFICWSAAKRGADTALLGRLPHVSCGFIPGIAAPRNLSSNL